ncbi:hypothetical protein MTR67_012787 [Solanum verrucosum]|uniref:Reverse transcriptase domain-containing protein n=1 Tax=Solanum verrucosum TaxID=315347 RepID=A0AAF0TGA2_SOLVR|nr:hypothetical protein MTR67_012787 [Solanum verrucosum]
MWATKKLNLDWGAAFNQRIDDLNALDEFRLKAYEGSALYNQKIKRLRLFPGKLKSKWTGPFLLTKLFPHGAVELVKKDGTRFMVHHKNSVENGLVQNSKDTIDGPSIHQRTINGARISQACRNAYKTPICMAPYQLVYGKSCHLPVELEHKVMWAIKKLNLDWGVASNQRIDDLNALDEFRLKAYESSALYKEKMKRYHDQRIEKREFVVGDLVLFFNSRLCLFPGKLKFKWTGPFLLTKLFSHVAIELVKKDGTRFMVNEQRIKIYLGNAETVQEVVEAYNLDEV